MAERKDTLKRAMLAGLVSVALAVTSLPALARGYTVYRSPELRVTEYVTGPGGYSRWRFINRTDDRERVACRFLVTVLMDDGGSIQVHDHWTGTLEANATRSKTVEYYEGVVSIKATNWSCQVRS